MRPDIRHLFIDNRIAPRRRRGTTALAAAVLVAGMVGATGLAASPAWAAKSLAVKTASLPVGPEGAVYRAKLAAAGGTEPYTWSIASGKLPAGLTLVPATGLITGIPSLQAPARDQFTVRVSDSERPAETATAKLSIQTRLPAPLKLTAIFLPPATADAHYSQKLAATGGIAPYTWSIASGALPAGLTLHPGTGVISGTPRVGGVFRFTARVSCPAYGKAGLVTATANLSLAVNVAPLQITTGSTVPTAEVGVQYSLKLDATGGIGPFTWSIASGSFLPPGLWLDPSTGVISGGAVFTAAFSGHASFTVSVTDSESPAQVADLLVSMTVIPPLSVATTSLPVASVGSPYTAQLSASGGVAPYTWSLIPGTQLPAGLSLSPDGSITGIPEAGGSAWFGALVTDAHDPSGIASSPVYMTVGFNIQG
jgi:hypothetical protein